MLVCAAGMSGVVWSQKPRRQAEKDDPMRIFASLHRNMTGDDILSGLKFSYSVSKSALIFS